MSVELLYRRMAHLIHHSHHAEHAGLVVYAGAEVIHAQAWIYYVSVWLVLTGLTALIVEIRGLEGLMSSLVRRIQKRIARDQGYQRDKEGFIINSDGDRIGRRWPQVAAPTKGS